MQSPDFFTTLRKESSGSNKDRGSKFLAFAYPVSNEEMARDIVKALRKEHFAAAHVCWALVLGPSSEIQKSSDDREPSGSAGKPILRALLEKEITFAMVAVVRYFGGKLLGVPGLIQAYGEAARAALTDENLIQKNIINRIFQACSYENQHVFIRLAKQQQIRCYPFMVEEREGLIFEVYPGKTEAFLIKLSEIQNGKGEVIETVYL